MELKMGNGISPCFFTFSRGSDAFIEHVHSAQGSEKHYHINCCQGIVMKCASVQDVYIK